MRRQVTKRMILLTTCLVFALALSGTVAAEDSQGGALDDRTAFQSEQSNGNNNESSVDDDPRIYGVIKENTTQANGASITIKNPTTNVTIASGTTNSTGEYDISFLSNLTEFKVEIAYLTYKNFTTTVTTTGLPIPTANLNHTFMPSQMLKTVKMIVFVSGTRIGTIDKVMNDVYLNQLLPAGYDFELRIFSEDTLSTDAAILERFANEIKTANILLTVDLVSSTFTSITLSPIIQQMPAGSAFYRIGGSSGVFSSTNGTALTSHSSVASANLNAENIKRAMLEALRQYQAIDNNTNTTVITLPTDFVYHPDTNEIFTTLESYVNWYKSEGKYNPNGPWVGLLFHSWYYGANDLAAYNALIHALEERGANVIVPIFTSFSSTANKFFIVNGTPAIDVLIVHLHSGMTDNASLAILNQLNVPILSPVHLYLQDTLDGYLANSTGLTGNELAVWTITPEINGRIEPIIIGGSRIVGTDPITGADIKIFAPYRPGIDQLADRAFSWGNLRHILNQDKKLALIYFDNTHDEGMPVGGSLNIEASLTNILKALEAEGYDLGSLDVGNLTPEILLDMIKDHGRNLVNYTQQDLEDLIQKGAPTMTVERYLQLYNALPEKLRQEVEAVWGSAPGNLMIYNGLIVFPGLMLGNIFVGPQPIWKWNGSTSGLDNETLPPTHQYIAFYLWLQDDFDADAVVHTGEHGTMELLPGHTAGMTADDWPNTLIGEMPHIYIFSGSNDNAKRRAYAVIISHLTPPVVETELYGNLLEMHDLINSYVDAYNLNDTERMGLIKTQILGKINNQNGLSERLGINSTTGFGTVINKLHDYLHELQSALTPYGLHTFGELPDNETLELYINAIISYDPVNRTGQHDYILNLLNQSVTNEMDSLLNALNGGFIKPGVAADPVRDLTSLPTGKNIYSFNPKKVPDAAATTIGFAAAEEVLKRYVSDNNGEFPETIGTSISGSAVVNNKGAGIATIFYYLGVKPITINGVIVGTEVIPLENMTITIGNVTVQRPRIDVFIGTSVSFINLCYNVIELIDNAVLQVATLNESTEQNFVRKHYLAMIPQLKAELLAQGLSDAEAESQAKLLAQSRMFGLPEGADPHAMGTARILRSSETWTEDELAEAYLEYESHIYGAVLKGVPGRSVMEKLLMTIDTTMALSSTTRTGTFPRGITNIEFMVERLTNKNINGYVVNTGNAKISGSTVTGVKVQTVSEAVYDGIAMTLFNPVWREGMLKEGSAGQRRMALAIRSMYTLNLNGDISSATWQQIADMYLFGQNRLTDPMATAMIADVLYQVNNRGMTQLSSAQADQLSQMLGVPVKGQTTTTTTTTSGQQSASPGVVGISSAGVTSQSSSAGASSDSSADTAEAGDQSAGETGKAYEVSQATPQGVTDSPWGAYAIVGVISVLALAGIGFFFKGNKFGQ